MSEIFKGETRAENRRHPRLQLKIWVHYQLLKPGEATRTAESLSEDLGAGGIAIRSHSPVADNQLLLLTLYLPPEDKREGPAETLIYSEDDCLPVEILACAAWSAQKQKQDYMVGVQFLEIKREHRKRLKDFLVDYQLALPDSRLYR